MEWPVSRVKAGNLLVKFQENYLKSDPFHFDFRFEFFTSL